LALSESLFVVHESSPLAVAAKPFVTQIHGEHFFNSSGWLIHSKVYARHLLGPLLHVHALSWRDPL
jgi:ribulose-5-phosphate 4-epimerase/fuculose-1-phosphate aldolase